MERLWKPNKKYDKSKPQWLGNMPYERLYKNLTREQLLNLLQTAKKRGWQVLDLRRCGLDSLPSELLELRGLRQLALGNLPRRKIFGDENRFETLPPGIGGALPELWSLDLRDVPVAELPGSFWFLKSLRGLALSGENMDKFPEEMAWLTGLRALYVENVDAADLLNAIGNLQELRTLKLRLSGGNASSDEAEDMYLLLDEICGLGNLQTLDLSDSGFLDLPEEIGRLTNLQTLDLSSNGFEDMPEEIGRLTNLQTLDLSYTQLTRLPEEIGRLANLQTLDLSSNNFEELPWEIIWRLANLRTLNFSFNSMDKLPPEIGSLKRLQALNLSINNISELPPEIGSLTELQTLDLSFNDISELPPEIGSLTELQTLDLSQNPALSRLPLAMEGLICLRRLDLTRTEVERADFLSRMPKLKTKFGGNQDAGDGDSGNSGSPSGKAADKEEAKAQKDKQAREKKMERDKETREKKKEEFIMALENPKAETEDLLERQKSRAEFLILILDAMMKGGKIALVVIALIALLVVALAFPNKLPQLWASIKEFLSGFSGGD